MNRKISFSRGRLTSRLLPTARRLLFAACWLSSSLFPLLLHADSYIKLSPKELQQLSERIVRAKVTGVRSEWNSARTFVFTYVTLEVNRNYKGSGPATIDVRVPGGKVGNYSVTAESMPKFDAGDDIVVFLNRWNDGAVKVEGYFQGVSRVVPSPKGPVLRGGSLDNRLVNEVEVELATQ